MGYTLVGMLAEDSLTEINTPDSHGDTPLHIAASCKNSRAVQILKKAGASTGILNSEGKTPLDLDVTSGPCLAF